MSKPYLYNNNIWEERWNAVNDYLDILISRKDDELCHRLFKILQTFGQQQFKFFLEQLHNGTLQSLASINEDSPFNKYSLGYSIDEYILQTTLDQIVNDMFVIQRAQEQRIVSINNSQQYIKDAWKTADGLVFHGLKQIEDLLPTDFWQPTTPTVLTYLQKDHKTRIIPYAPVAIVGVPLTSLAVPTDFLAVPHELGHFLYWQGVTEQNQPYWFALREALESLDPKPSLRHWQEEIFADVIGVLLGGPIVAYSFQELQLPLIGAAFTEDSGTHPISAMRPFVHTQTLLKLVGLPGATEFKAIAENLEYQWNTILDDRKVVLFNLPVKSIGQSVVQPRVTRPIHRDRPSETISVNEIEEFKIIIQVILDLLPASWLAQRFVPDGNGDIPAWTYAFDIDKPYEAFKNRVNVIVEKGLTAKTAGVLPDEDLDKRQALLQTTVFPDQPLSTTSPIAPETWLRILHFAGWATKGPGGDKIQGD